MWQGTLVVQVLLGRPSSMCSCWGRELIQCGSELWSVSRIGSGPAVIFSLYTVPLGAIVKRHGLDFHFYADDCRLYLFVQSVKALVDKAVTVIERCDHELRAWLPPTFPGVITTRLRCWWLARCNLHCTLARAGITVFSKYYVLFCFVFKLLIWWLHVTPPSVITTSSGSL